MPRRPDPFKPAEGVVYTNGQVNRAGQMLRRWYGREKGKSFDDFDFSVDDLVDLVLPRLDGHLKACASKPRKDGVSHAKNQTCLPR
jgi:hypothetical protein